MKKFKQGGGKTKTILISKDARRNTMKYYDGPNPVESINRNDRRTKMTDDKHSSDLNKEDKTTRYIIRGKYYVSRPSTIDMILRKIGEDRYTCEKL